MAFYQGLLGLSIVAAALPDARIMDTSHIDNPSRREAFFFTSSSRRGLQRENPPPAA
jgi:hypothetical protein